MGNNFFIPLEADATPWTALAFNAPLIRLDRMGTYNRPMIIFIEGVVNYVHETETLVWDNKIHIYFTDSEGKTRHNWVQSGNVVVADDKIVYVGLNESTAQISIQTALVTPDSASNFLAYDVVVLGYKSADSDKFVPTGLAPAMLSQGDGVQVLTCATTLDIDWAHEKSAYLLLDQDVDTLTFSGMLDGQTYTLETKQDAGTPYAIAFPGGITWENDDAPVTIQELDEVELFEFQKTGSAIYGRKIRTGVDSFAVSVDSSEMTLDFARGTTCVLLMQNAYDNIALTFKNVSLGTKYYLLIIGNPSGGNVIDWASVSGSTFSFPGGVAPTISTGARDTDIIEFFFASDVLYGKVWGLDFQEV